MMSIMLCTNWVCVGTFDDHEWVSESTTTQHWYNEHVVVFSTHEVEWNIGK